MILSGHQPVYLPWPGLFHKVSLCDTFVYMDTVQYLTQDWNNRNKIKTANGPIWLTVPVSVKKNQLIPLNEVKIAEQEYPLHKSWQYKHWKSIELNYKKSPFFNQYSDFFYFIYNNNRWKYLNDLNESIFKYLLDVFNLKVKFIKMSEGGFEGQKSDLILNQCLKLGANIIVLGAQGPNYIKKQDFHQHNIKILFQNYNFPEYFQHFGLFESHLSVIDLLFNYGPKAIDIILSNNITKKDLLEGKYFE